MSLDLRNVERIKYEKVWTRSEYRQGSPAESLLKKNFVFIKDKFNLNEGDTFIEYGAGTGRGSLFLAEKGMKVQMLDIAHNCLDKQVLEALGSNLRFNTECLWDMEGYVSDYFVCIDVMEHLPLEKVEQVLGKIEQQTQKGGLFGISCVPDAMGALIGETLHMTVMRPDWWEQLISQYFTLKKVIKGENDISILVGKR